MDYLKLDIKSAKYPKELYEHIKEKESKPAMEWIAFDHDKPESRPKEYGKYLICRKDGKIHWETWNGTGWAYNHNEIRYYALIIPPQNGNK